MLRIFRDLLGAGPELMALSEAPRPLEATARLAPGGPPVRLDLGARELLLVDESASTGVNGAGSASWTVRDAEPDTALGAFIRLRPGESMIVGRDDARFQRLFALPRSLPRRQLELRNADGELLVRNLAPDHRSTLSLSAGETGSHHARTRRLASLARVRAIVGGDIATLEPDAALSAVRAAIDALDGEPYRPRDPGGRAGGLLELPRTLVPIIVGDLHCELDNLLRVLCEDGCLEALERNEAYLLLLGDTVHREEPPALLDEMDGSLLMLDFLCRLKAALPRNVFWLRGNHESFDESVGKSGVPQGLLLREAACERRGAAYAQALAQLFDALPYLAHGDDFIACHAGAPRATTTVAELVDIRHHAALARELLWVRPRRPGQPTGFGKRDVDRLRRVLGLSRETPLIVGHTPLSEDGALWLDAADIPDLHIVFDARRDTVPVFTRLRGGLAPLEYAAEPLLDLATGAGAR